MCLSHRCSIVFPLFHSFKSCEEIKARQLFTDSHGDPANRAEIDPDQQRRLSLGFRPMDDVLIHSKCFERANRV